MTKATRSAVEIPEEFEGRPHRKRFEHLLDRDHITLLVSSVPSPTRIGIAEGYLEMKVWMDELPPEYAELKGEKAIKVIAGDGLDAAFRRRKGDAAGPAFQRETKKWRVADGADTDPVKSFHVDQAAQVPDILNVYPWNQGIYHGNWRNNDGWLASRAIVMDMDDGTTEETALEWLHEAGITPWFIYRSGSWSPEKHKFRVGILLTDYVIGSSTTYEALATWVYDDVFRGRPDRASKTPSQAWLGGKDVILANDASCAWDPSPILPQLVRDAWVQGNRSGHGAREASRLASGFARDGFAFDSGSSSDLIKGWREELRADEREMLDAEFAEMAACREVAADSHPGELHGDPTTTVLKSGDSRGTRQTQSLDIRSWQGELCETCRLMEDLIQGPGGPEARLDPGNTHFQQNTQPGWLYHQELVHLLFSLVSIKGGEKAFLAALDSHPIYAQHGRGSDNYRAQAKHMRSRGMHPSRCRSDRCRHYEVCPNNASSPHGLLASRGPRRVEESEERAALTEVRELASGTIEQTIATQSGRISVVQADTGVGKTETVLIYLESHPDAAPLTIVVPTHALKRELLVRALDKGIDIVSQPDPPELPSEMQSVLEAIYRSGDVTAAHRWLRKHEREIPDIARFFRETDRFRTESGRRHSIITHKRFVGNDSWSDGRQPIVVIDEDPTDSIYPQGTISSNLVRETIEELGDELPGGGVILEWIEELKRSRAIMPLPAEATRMVEALMQRDDLPAITRGGDLISMLRADHACIVRGDIAHIRRNPLPEGSVTILSATLSEWFARNVLFSVEGCEHVRIGGVESAGVIIQDASRTCSRTNIKANLAAIKAEVPEGFAVICHKEFVNEFRAAGHFGAIEGLNNLAGRDLCVIGTDHIPPHCYALLATASGMRETGRTIPVMHTRFVEHDGWRFKLHTFEDETLRRIQLSLVSASLHQAVGRARVLEHDCIVLVMSNMPVTGAVMVEPRDIPRMIAKRVESRADEAA